MPVIQFKGKTAIESYHHTIPHHTLEFDQKLSLLPKGEKPSLDGNLIIEGDNLLALKALLPTHAGRVKCIYIDPPYNTGNEGWVYNDNLTQPQFKEWIGKTVGKEGEDFTRHDKWCCMMYPRLQLLKEPLRDDGVIFISIDDNEVHHLRGLMDEIFGEENFYATIVWQKRDTPSNDAIGISVTHEYVLVYVRTQAFTRGLVQRTAEQEAIYKNPDNDPRGVWTRGALTRKEVVEKDVYPITNPKGREVLPPPGTSWRVSRTSLKRLIAEDRLWWGRNRDGDMPFVKRFLSEVQPGVVPITWWEYEFAGSNRNAKMETRAIFDNEVPFETAKPSSLIKRLLQIANDAEALVFDCTAGSGTTGHAVLALNTEDGGNRKFILVQQPYDTKNNEKARFNICREVTAERVRRVIDGYSYTNQRGKNEKVDGLGGSFNYVRMGPALFGEYRNFGTKLPTYEEIAKYIFYTETSNDFDKKALIFKTGKIGEYRKTSYYLLYTPNNKEDQALDLDWLKSIEKSEKNRNIVVYCEKIWIHRDDLAKYEKDTGRKVRPMLIPFNLK